MEDGPLWHFDAEHLFKADGLRAELHLVCDVGTFAPALVFDGVGQPPAPPAESRDADAALFVAAELNHVGRAAEAEPPRAEREVRGELHLAAALAPHFVNLLMQMRPFDSQDVLLPEPLKINKSPLLLAEHKVLKPGDEKVVFFGEHGYFAGSSMKIPSAGFPSIVIS